MTNYRFSIIIEKDDDGYFASCNELQGCFTQGETYEETIESIKNAISLHVEDRIAAGEKIQPSQYVSLFLIVYLYERLAAGDKRHRGDYLDFKKYECILRSQSKIKLYKEADLTVEELNKLLN